jgi:hypothetical protein
MVALTCASWIPVTEHHYIYLSPIAMDIAACYLNFIHLSSDA